MSATLLDDTDRQKQAGLGKAVGQCEHHQSTRCEISGRPGQMDTLLAILRHPAAAVVSDAEDFGRGAPHPAHAGAFARVLRMVREDGVLSLEEAIRRMTSRPASLVGIPDRGVIREDAWADLVVLDPERVADRATWEDPRRPAEPGRDGRLTEPSRRGTRDSRSLRASRDPRGLLPARVARDIRGSLPRPAA